MNSRNGVVIGANTHITAQKYGFPQSYIKPVCLVSCQATPAVLYSNQFLLPLATPFYRRSYRFTFAKITGIASSIIGFTSQ